MTRLFKVSLSVVALLLVALMVFTGCGKANEALTTAEEAKKAVTDATAELEAALANKADAKELTDKLAALTAAIQKAETVSADGDAALDAAIKAAKDSITANVDALLKAHKIDVAGLIAGKANKEEVNAQVKDLMDMVKNIETATLGSINLKDYVDWNTVIAAYLFELDEINDAVKAYETLYDADDFAEIQKAYKIAEVSLYRSFGTDENTEMADAAFQVYRDALAKYPNNVDKVYYGENGVLAYEALEAKTTEAAKALYEKVKAAYDAADATGKALIKAYYVIGETNRLEPTNLIDKTLGEWKTQVLAETTAFGKLFPVYTGNEKFGTDAADYTAIEGKVTAFRTAFTTLGAANTAVTAIEDTDITAFLKNGTIITAINDAATGAVAAAEDVAELAYSGDIVLTPACVNAINAWDTAWKNWVSTFLTANKPAVLEGENISRYDEVASLIEDTQAALIEVKAELDEVAKPYKDDAKPFMEIVAKFYDEDKKVDKTLVGLLDGAKISEAFDKALEWAAKYEHLDLALIYGAGEKKPGEVVSETVVLKQYYSEATEQAVIDWKALDHDAIAALVAETAELTIYDEDVYAVYGWFTTYKLEKNGTYQEGCDHVELTAANADYFAQVKALKADLDKLIADKKAAAAALNKALNDLAQITLKTEANIQAAKDLDTAYKAVGTVNEYKTGGNYDTLNTAREFTIVYGTKIADAEAKIIAIKAAQKAMNDAAAVITGYNEDLNEAYPFFNATVAQNAYDTAIADLASKITEFITANQNKDEGYTADAQKILDDAKTLTALQNVLTAELKVKENNKLLNAVPDFFNASINKTTYSTDVEALRDMLVAYNGTASKKAADVEGATATLAAADLKLDQQELYETVYYTGVYSPIVTQVTAALDGDAETKALAELKICLDEFAARIITFTAEEIEAYNSTAGNEKIAAEVTNLTALLKNQAKENGVTIA